MNWTSVVTVGEGFSTWVPHEPHFLMRSFFFSPTASQSFYRFAVYVTANLVSHLHIYCEKSTSFSSHTHVCPGLFFLGITSKSHSDLQPSISVFTLSQEKYTMSDEWWTSVECSYLILWRSHNLSIIIRVHPFPMWPQQTVLLGCISVTDVPMLALRQGSVSTTMSGALSVTSQGTAVFFQVELYCF